MQHSEQPSTVSLRSSRTRQLSTIAVALAAVGLADASYLAAKYISGTVVPCGIGQGCDVVTRSAYAEIAGIPIALIGACWYLVLIIGWFVAREWENRIWTILMACSTFLGAAASVYLVYLMLVVIQAVCTYCMLSAFIQFSMLGIGIATLYAVHHSSRSSVHE
ncbi:MAG: vitamin K epoxide reductase family protein [Patescibacteria group bacterium]